MTTLEDYDFLGLDEESLADPYPFFALLREQGPVWQDPKTGVYLVSHFDDVVDVARAPEIFSSIVASTGHMSALAKPEEGRTVSDVIDEFRRNNSFMANSLLTRDPPDHARYRALVNKVFTPKRLAVIEKYAYDLATELVDEFADAGEVEFVRSFAGPYPLVIVADLLGVPREDHATFRKYLRGEGEIEETRIGNPDDAGALNSELMTYLFEYFSNYIEDRRKHPRDDIMSELANSTFPGTDEVPSMEDLVGLAFILFGAGQETTVRLFTTGTEILARNPELQAALRADPAGIPNFIEETLRYDTPVKGLFRVARVDTEIGGVPIPAGAIVMVLWASGNRDVAHFAHPDQFDPGRAEARHTLSFGHGIHYCVGAPLARFETRIGFETLLARLGNIRMQPGHERVDRLPSFILRGTPQLFLAFDPLTP